MSKPMDFRMGGNSTTVMSDYHICKYDAVLGVLVCVGNDSKVLVLGKDMTRELLPMSYSGLHWLDCFVYAGTTTFLVLAPEVLVCMDYSTPEGETALFPRGAADAFTCLHVPPGLTCGAVGRKDGSVSFFRLQPPLPDHTQGRPRLAWTSTEVSVLGLCQPFLKGSGVVVDKSAEGTAKFFTTGSVLALDSYPDNPNAFISVVAGVQGVSKWYVDERRISCFFDAHSLCSQPDSQLATCKVTPGGNYVVALTLHSSRLLVWSEGKKKRDKLADFYWVVDLTEGITRDALHGSDNPFWFNEYRVGIHMARTALTGTFYSTNDKHSQMYVLVYGQRDIMEIVIRLDDKQVIRREQIIAHLNAYTASAGVEAARARVTTSSDDTAAESYFKVFHVEPCAISNYWNSALVDVDLEALFVTSSGGLRPILAKRNRQTGGIESIHEIRELSTTAPWFPRALLLRLPDTQLRALAAECQRAPAQSTWEKLLRGGDSLLSHALPEIAAADAPGSLSGRLWSRTVMATVTDAAQTICLSAESNEIFAVSPGAVQNCVPWTTLAFGQDPASLLLEEALPALDIAFVPSEVILRVYATESMVMLMKTDIRRNSGALVWDLDRVSLELEVRSTGGGEGVCLVREAQVIDARLEPSHQSGEVSIYPDGKSLLLQLADSSFAVVDMSGAKDNRRRPYIIRVPSGLLPVGVTTVSTATFWGPSNTLYLCCLFASGKGFLLWDLSHMRLVTYQQTPYAANAVELKVAHAMEPAVPNLGGDVRAFEVTLHTREPLTDPQECGEVVCSDALGGRVFTILVAYGIAGRGGGWCFRTFTTPSHHRHLDEEWVDLGSLTSSVLRFVVNVADNYSALDLSVFVGTDNTQTTTVSLVSTITQVRATWLLGKAELTYNAPGGDMRSYVLNATMLAAGPTQGTERRPRRVSCGDGEGVLTTVAFISATALTLVDVTSALVAGGRDFSRGNSDGSGLTVLAMCRLDPARRWEHVRVYHSRGALLAITRDANGWRWISVLDSRTASPRMESYATLDFAGEAHIQLLPVEINNILHLYLLGMDSGVIGHLFIEANLGSHVGSSILSRKAFSGRQYQPTPWNYRGYGRFIPPAPTLKQEVSFFKRLLTLPWEDVALKLESETLRDAASLPAATHRQEATAEPHPKEPALTKLPARFSDSTTTTAPLSRDRPSMSKQEELPLSRPAAPGAAPCGSRYAQLKEVAERENVSLTEARRMMSENVRKLQERGEKLNHLQDRSADLAQSALTFQDLARQLKEKRKSSWL